MTSQNELRQSMMFRVVNRIRLLFGLHPEGESHDQGSLSYIWYGVGITAAVTFIDIFAWAWRFHYADLIGVWLYLLGAYIRTRARFELGTLFTFHVKVMPNHSLKTDGLYRFMRHPGYTGLMIEVLGWIVFFRTPLGLVAGLMMFLPAMINRIAIEEKVLRGHFGPEYDEYASKVKALVPGLY